MGLLPEIHRETAAGVTPSTYANLFYVQPNSVNIFFSPILFIFSDLQVMLKNKLTKSTILLGYINSVNYIYHHNLLLPKYNTKMTPEQFKDNYSQVKDLIKGHGPQIANDARLSYTTYFNVIRGQVTDPDKILAVWEAMKEKVNELVAGVADL